MTIEHRYCARRPIELKVYIRYRKRRFFCATGRDLSDQGMFLEVRNLTLPTGTMVELDLSALGRDWLIPAIVTHRAESGIGVIFRESRPELLGVIGQIGAEPRHAASATAEAEPRLGVLG
jgi:hypothetical protein